MIVSENVLLFAAGIVVAGIGYCVKKLENVDKRLVRIETLLNDKELEEKPRMYRHG